MMTGEDADALGLIPPPADPPPEEYAVTRDHVVRAVRAIQGVAVETPVVAASALFGDAPWTARTLLKLECLQRTGSFKLRGALARLHGLRGVAGVVAASGGNHGAAIAFAARRFGIPAAVVMPEATPRARRERVAAEGAEVVVAGATYDAAEEAARALARKRHWPFVSPYDDPWVMAGAGTLGVELAAVDGGRGPSDVVLPVGGGGLAAGLAAGLRCAGVEATLIGAQAAECAAMAVSFERNEAVLALDAESCAEALRGGVTAASFALVARAVAGIALVGEEEVVDAMSLAARGGLMIEPSAAVALAAATRLPPPAHGRRVVLLTGRNVA